MKGGSSYYTNMQNKDISEQKAILEFQNQPNNCKNDLEYSYSLLMEKQYHKLKFSQKQAYNELEIQNASAYQVHKNNSKLTNHL